MRRERLFFDANDYRTFERLLSEALVRIPTRLLAYCIMPNHWHLVLWPYATELPRFMHWLTLTHATRWHLAKGSRGTGHVYQNRYNAIPVQTEGHLLTLLRYVERNAATAGLVERAEDWRWCSLWRRCNFCDDLPLASWPISQPEGWISLVNQPQTARELSAIHTAVRHQRPFGEATWAADLAAKPSRPVRGRDRV